VPGIAEAIPGNILVLLQFQSLNILRLPDFLENNRTPSPIFFLRKKKQKRRRLTRQKYNNNFYYFMPYYIGKVKCIYIDPPYNTGNENWVYNDKVNSPKIKKWLGKVVGGEAQDLCRHDKWLFIQLY